MKKIMFNDRYGLTQAVLEGKKTMTRRIVPIDLYNQTDWKAVDEGNFEAVVDGEGDYHDIRNCGKYHVGEKVAIAQRYEDAINPLDWVNRMIYQDEKGWTNKMFVRADLMPHRIRITNIKVERLQDISEEDAMREGVLKAPFDGYHVTGIGMTVPKSMARPIGQTADGKPVYGDRYRDFKYGSPREAFAALIDRISGKGTWQSNPWVYVYTFELI